jgi:alpha-tubulin suppressor-like RCC1 family protein
MLNSIFIHFCRKSLHYIKKDRLFSSYLYSRGCGLFGALGQNDSLRDSDHFNLVTGISHGKVAHGTTIQVSASWGHSACVTTNKAYIFGRPFDFSSLFTLNNIRFVSKSLAKTIAITSKYVDFGETVFLKPIELQEFFNNKITSIKCSAALTLFLTSSGEVYALGNNRWGQCGFEEKQTVLTAFFLTAASQNVYTSKLIEGIDERVVSIDTGLQHCVALTDTGNVYTWGKCNRGQLGIGNVSRDKVVTATRISSLKNIVSISAGFAHTAAVDQSGALYVWGKGMSEKVTREKGNISMLTPIIFQYYYQNILIL